MELQAITALAHIRGCLLFFIDVSEQCGYTLSQQLHLFDSLKPLFRDKPAYVIATKVDAAAEEVDADRGGPEKEEVVRPILDKVKTSVGGEVEVLVLNHEDEKSVEHVKRRTCDAFLEHLKARRQKVVAGGQKTRSSYGVIGIGAFI